MQPSQPVRRNPGQPAVPVSTSQSHGSATEPTHANPYVGAQATRFLPIVRYRTKMRNGQCFPLVVILQEEGRPLARKEQFAPDGSKPMLSVYPIIAGAQVTPVSVDIAPMHGSEAKFWVAPVARGTLRDARVELRSGGRVVSSVPLSMTVSSRRLTKFLAFLTIALPLLFLYLRTHPMVVWKTEMARAAARQGDVDIPKTQPGGRSTQPGGAPGVPGGPTGGRPGPGGPGGPGGARPQGPGPNRNSNDRPSDAPKKDQEAKSTDKVEISALDEVALAQETTEKKTTAQDAKDEKKSDKPADAKQTEKKPEGSGKGSERPAGESTKPEDADKPQAAANGVSRQYELKLEGGDALTLWFQREASRIRYNSGEVYIGDSADALVFVLVWLNNDGFTWLQKDKLPAWANEYCLDYALGDKWKPNNAIASIYDRILNAPFLELFTLCALFVLTLLVRLAQDPKRRTRKGAAFAI